MRGVHQLLSRLYRGDGIGNQAMALQRLFLSWGMDSKIFASHTDAHPPPGTYPSAMYETMIQSGDVTILHYGAYSIELDLFSRSDVRRVLSYHNITPPRFFVNHALRHYYETALGRLQLPRAVGVAAQCWAESTYNKRELDALGATNARVIPLFLDFAKLDAVEPDRQVLARYSNGVTNIVSIGRLVPNKRQDRVISAFAKYHQEFDSRSRLLLVGRQDEIKPYRDELRALAARLHVEQSVVFTGHVTSSELVAYYRVANLLLCLSEHEGFGVPVVEAMHFGIPVVALRRAALPETLGGAGILLEEPDEDATADAIWHLSTEPAYRARIVEAQRRRLRDLEPSKVTEAVRRCLEDLQR